MVHEIKHKSLWQLTKQSAEEIGYRTVGAYAFMAFLFVVIAATFILAQQRQTIVQNAAYDVTTKTFLATFDTNPASPQPWTQIPELQNFDVAIHSRDQGTWDKLEEMDADHGTDCAASQDNALFPKHHIAGVYQESIFNCKNHIMTSIKAGGYGEIILTPAAIADWSEGSVNISVDVSTYRSSGRDWWGIMISPYDENLVLPLENWLPDLDGFPKNGLHFTADGGSGTFNGEQIADGASTDVKDKWWVKFDDLGLSQSKANRSHYVWTISKTHVTVGIETPATNGTCPNNNWSLNGSTCSFHWIDNELPTPLNWTRGIVQFEHHSYNPEKDCDVANPPAEDGTCHAGTWHWDNFYIKPAIPFTVIKAQQNRLVGTNKDTVTANFAPAPKNAKLRFAAVCKVDVAYNGGTFQPASNMATTKHAAGDFDTNPGTSHSYFLPVPDGTTTVEFKFHPDGWYTEWPCLVEDPAFWTTSTESTTNPSNSPTEQPTASPTVSPSSSPTVIPTATITPKPTATPTPTPKPTATPTPTPIPTSTPTPIPTKGPTPTITPTPTSPITGIQGLTGTYYNNRDFTSFAMSRVDSQINFNWRSSSPNVSMQPDTFSVLWTGALVVPKSDTYTLYTRSDYGVRVWIDNNVVIKNWGDHAVTENSGRVYLTEGYHAIKIDYYENRGQATMQLLWKSSSIGKQIIPTQYLRAQ